LPTNIIFGIVNRDKKPLFRKENKVSLTTKYYVVKGGDFRHQRNTKKFLKDERSHTPMNAGNYGYDYTPLFKFLLSKIGEKWGGIYSEAKSRLDKEEPIFWLVALRHEDREDIVRYGESSYYSGLCVDDAGLLQKVNPNAGINNLISKWNLEAAWFETYSFNGKAVSVPRKVY